MTYLRKMNFIIIIKSTRNLISTLMKRSKQNYYSKYFESNITNIKIIEKASKA